MHVKGHLSHAGRSDDVVPGGGQGDRYQQLCDHPARLRRYVEAYALNTAGVAEDKSLYDAAGINRKTALAYERLLTNLLIVEATPAWTSNRLKRLVLSPKRQWPMPPWLERSSGSTATRSCGAGICSGGSWTPLSFPSFAPSSPSARHVRGSTTSASNRDAS